jgi:hypothetical protein
MLQINTENDTIVELPIEEALNSAGIYKCVDGSHIGAILVVDNSNNSNNNGAVIFFTQYVYTNNQTSWKVFNDIKNRWVRIKQAIISDV